MTFVTYDIILSRGTNIVMCHRKDLTRDNNKILQKNKIKKNKKIKLESDMLCVVNGINYFFF